MLCFANPYNKFGEICTNRCPERHRCTIQKSSILIEATDILASEINSEEVNGICVTSFVPYCSAPEAYLNGVIDDYQPPANQN
jgi:hypothetical protein